MAKESRPVDCPYYYADYHRGRDLEVHRAEGFTYYSVFSLWDTFRALHPLLTIIDRERTTDFVRTMLRQYEEGGRLPVWELAANETDTMIGYTPCRSSPTSSGHGSMLSL
jgi:putative alpha-1,2-mannosidase